MRALLKFLDIVSLYQLFYNDFLSVPDIKTRF